MDPWRPSPESPGCGSIASSEIVGLFQYDIAMVPVDGKRMLEMLEDDDNWSDVN
jgi:hypothetical protein